MNSRERKTYYVPGSGLIAVPHSRMNEIPRLKLEVHSEELKWARMAALVRKLV